jgi:hypothetical protein
MFITGVGIGPTLSVYTIVVQNAVPRERLGVATSNLTFFRQVGGTVGLAIAGTIFGTTLSSVTPRQLRDGLLQAGVPADRIDSLSELAAGRSLDQDDLAGVGDLGARILDAVPEALRSTVEPFLGVVVEAIHEAFSLAVGETFWLGVLATVAAIGATVLIRDQPLRGPVEVPQATAGASVAS